MDHRNILVHVDPSDEGRLRLKNALALAKRSDARIVGVGAAAHEPNVGEQTLGIMQGTMKKFVEERIEDAEKVFRELASGAAAADWRTKIARPADALAEMAAGADLIFISRTGDVTAREVFAVPDDVVLQAGTPVLMQPQAARPLKAERIVVGWKNTRETRRALGDSLPLLKAASGVRLIRFTRGDVDDDPDGLELVEARLQHHGVKVEARRERRDNSVAEDLVAAAADFGADLIVAGAYAQSRTREAVLGGVTRSVIASAPVYVFFSH